MKYILVIYQIAVKSHKTKIIEKTKETQINKINNINTRNTRKTNIFLFTEIK